jgi:hypothetical protein
MITPQGVVDPEELCAGGVCPNLLKGKGSILTGGLSFSR